MRLIYEIPKPVSVNDYYANNRGAGRGRFITKRGQTWKRAALNEVARQRPELMQCRVRVTVELGEGAYRATADCDNFIKCVLDMLKAAGVLRDDNRKYVQAAGAVWVPGDGCRVILEECNEA